MSEWQPIETAPKDGTVMILYMAGGKNDPYVTFGLCPSPAKKGQWDEWLTFYFNYMGFPADGSAPTHWQPLPNPPILK